METLEDDREEELCWRVCQYVALIPIDLHRNAVPTLVREFVEREGGMASLRERFPDFNEDLDLMLVHECVDYLETRLPRAFILDRCWAYLTFKGFGR